MKENATVRRQNWEARNIAAEARVWDTMIQAIMQPQPVASRPKWTDDNSYMAAQGDPMTDDEFRMEQMERAAVKEVVAQAN